MSPSRRLSAAVAVALCVARSDAIWAQVEPESGEEVEVEAPARLSLIGRLGVARLARWLAAEDPNERLRGIERLARVGTPAALDRLTAYAFERRAQLVGREWLALARALAPFAAEPKAQLTLAMLLNQSPNRAAGPEEAALLELGRGTAALALAAEGSSGALLVLGRAVRAAGAPAAAAADALLAHPPAMLEPLLDPPGQPSVELARLLGELGDQRAFHTLRDWVRSEPPDVRAAAAVALTRLGHLETVPLAALWLEGGAPELRPAAVEILLLAHDARAEPALRALLAEGRAGPAERRSLLAYPGPGLGPAVVEALERDAGASWRWTLLGRIGGDAAAERLARALGGEGSTFAAAHALSRSPGAAAHAALQAALDATAPAPLAVRAAAARAHELGDRFVGLDARAAAWLDSEDPRERAAAAWVRSLAGGVAAVRELESGDEVRLRAAATNALVFDDAALDAAAELLSRAPPGATRAALGACLIAPRVRRSVSSELLWSLVAEGGPARPLALRALAGRDDVEKGAGASSYLEHPDALLRQHVARGLGENSHPSVVGLLVGRLAFETDEGVRRAIVMALGAHRGRAVTQWLERAARLDPSPRVRSVARLGLAGVPLADATGGGEFLWAELRSTNPPEQGETPGSAALLSLAPGLAMPVVADPGGVLVVSGLPSSHLGFRLQ